MERECHDILGPLGLDKSISRRVAGALLQVEADYIKVPSQRQSKREPSWFRDMLHRIARTPSALRSRDAESLRNGNGSLQGDDVNLKVGDQDVGMTAFLLKLGEGMEDVPTSRLYISAFTIGMGYLLGGLSKSLYHFED